MADAGRRAADPRRHQGGDYRRLRPAAAGDHQPALERRQVLAAQLAGQRHAAAGRDRRDSFGDRSWAREFPPTSWRRSSAASSRWTHPTRGRRAAADWDWPSAAPSCCSTPGASGRSAIRCADRHSASFCHISLLRQRRAGRRRESETGHGTVVLADANAESRPRIAAQLARHGYSVVQAATVEQTLSAARSDPRPFCSILRWMA